MMKRFYFFAVLLIGFALIFTACGDSKDKPAKVEEVKEAAPEATTESVDDKGVTVAKAILNTFDEAVAEVAELIKDKPDAAELKPKLEALYLKYAEKMKELNVKYLALKGEDIVLFGSANTYLGEFRGKHVFKKDQTLEPFLNYYPDNEEITNLIFKEPVNLLEIAVKREPVE